MVAVTVWQTVSFSNVFRSLQGGPDTSAVTTPQETIRFKDERVTLKDMELKAGPGDVAMINQDFDDDPTAGHW